MLPSCVGISPEGELLLGEAVQESGREVAILEQGGESFEPMGRDHQGEEGRQAVQGLGAQEEQGSGGFQGEQCRRRQIRPISPADSGANGSQ